MGFSRSLMTWDGDGEHGEPSSLEADGDSWDGDGDGELGGL